MSALPGEIIPVPGDVDIEAPFKTALGALRASLQPGHIAAMADAIAAQEALVDREDWTGMPPITPSDRRNAIARGLLSGLGVTDSKIDEARKRIEAGTWEPGTAAPALTSVQ